MVKAFTAPKKEELLLSDLKWAHDPNEKFKHVWICVDQHPSIRDNVFYNLALQEQFFCSQKTWTDYLSNHYGHRLDYSMNDVFLALYKVLTIDYYEI